MAFNFTPERKKRADWLLSIYPQRRAALLPLLWLVEEQEGWLAPGAAVEVASLLGISEAEVYEAASFYTLLNRRPVGRHHIQVCTGVCCMLRGADAVLKRLEEKLGIGVGDTTPDGRFTLSAVECLGSCGTAPMMRVGDEYFEDLDADKLDGLLGSFK